jgi:type 2 lantibiotic biosynthesis protein LanM
MSSSVDRQLIAAARPVTGPTAAWDAAFDVLTERDWGLVGERRPAQLVDVDWPAVGRCVMAEEVARLRALCLRTLVLELNCARLLGQLAGETPEARFADFVARFSDRAGWEQLFAEYPVLGGAVDATRSHFRAEVLELFERLAADSADLAADGLPAPPQARLVSLTASLSDPHRGGRGVWKFGFDVGGAAAHLMYKPKSLAIDVRFQQVLARCNAAIDRGALSGVPPLRILRIVDRGSHGWVEHVAPDACRDVSAADRFYRRQGATLALLHVLLGTDIHHENLIAHGEHPVVVDLETLFHPLLDAPGEMPSARRAADGLIERSVLRVGLLPWRAFRHDGAAGINVGALGDGATQALPFPVARWEDGGRDDMRMVEKEGALPAADNVPRVGEQIAPFFAHIESIVAGFEAMARHLSRKRRAWLEPGGLLDSFADDPVRYILRPTRTYARLLQAGAHPDHLRDPESAARLRLALDGLTGGIASSPSVREAEDADLAARDIPYFGGRPGSAEVRDSRGHALPVAFPIAPLAAARERLAGLDGEEIERQVWTARAALAAAAFEHPVTAIGARGLGRAELDAAPAAERALSMAAEIGARLADRAVAGEDGITWIGVVDGGTSAFTVAPLGADLYDGVGGVALFLAALGQATGEERFLTLAGRAARVVRGDLEAGVSARVGGFAGIPSQLYALAHVGALAGDTSLVAALEPSLDRLSAELAATREVDVIYGAAGAVLGLLAFHATTGQEAVVPSLLACLDLIEHTAVAQDSGVTWTSDECGRPLLGFSHGNAGIACALARMADFLDEAQHAAAARARELAARARRFERARFDAHRKNWPDFRAPEPEGRSLVAWCHGAPGVVLSRMSGRPGPATLVDGESLAEVDVGVATTLDLERRGRHTLCHGDVGNLAIVAHLAERLRRDDWRERVASRLPSLLDEISAGPRVDSAFAEAAPGLMTGLSGVGYGLLALARPASLPLVLALEPPGARRVSSA